MKPRHWAVVVLGYLVALAVLAPAGLMAWGVAQVSAGRIVLHGVEGSFWRGRAAQLSIQLPRRAPVLLQAVSWQLAPHRLLTGGAPLRIENRAGDLVLGAGLGPATGGVVLSDARLKTSVAVLAPLLDTPWVRGAVGELELHGARLTLGADRQGRLEGELRIQSGPLPAGVYRLSVVGEGRRYALRWNGPLGPKAMSGGGWWDDRLHLDGVPGAVTR